MIVSESFKICICRASVPLNSTIRRFLKKYSSLSEIKASCFQSLFPREMALARIPVRTKKGLLQNGKPSRFSRKTWGIRLTACIDFWSHGWTICKNTQNQWWNWWHCLAPILKTKRERVAPYWPRDETNSIFRTFRLLTDKGIEGLECGSVGLSILSIKVFLITERNHWNHET